MKNGKLSINSDNIFPIIKKWLYHDKDIFTRELISNSNDAITKLKKLVTLGEATVSNEDYKIEVIINNEENTIKFVDNGIGMTAEEIDKYINEIAFSGARDFIEKHSKDTEENSIIGHFGLGFYSCFMVSEKVTIDTLSYKTDAEPILWECTGETDYTMTKGTRTDRGTTITLTLNEEGKEFLDSSKLITTVKNYCSYMTNPLYVYEEGKEENKTYINEVQPVWAKDPKECSEDDYITFYHNNFNDINNPLFWIHLNMDYPVKLKGILYFPKFNHDYELNEGQVKLYCNQVYVADNIKEVVPDFLLVLKGAIDCPELPLNVSRTFLQTDDYVKKISSYIIKKVADKLSTEKSKDLEKYYELWETLSTFVKFGCIRNDTFYEKVKNNIMFKTIYDKYTTLDEYKATLPGDEYQKKIYYVSDTAREASYISMFKDANINAVILNSGIDTHFIAFLEQKEHTVKFERIDSGINENTLANDKVDADTLGKMSTNLKEIFTEFIPTIKDFEIKAESFKSNDVAGMILISESSRRMQDMFKIYGSSNPFGDMPVQKSFVLNCNNKLVKYLSENKEDMKNQKETYDIICNELYDLARINSEGLNETEMNNFIKRSQKMMNMIIK